MDTIPYLDNHCYDLITPDGMITQIESIDKSSALVTIFIDQISPLFVGFEIDQELCFFNLKSTLAQLGMDSRDKEIHLDKKSHSAFVKILLRGFGSVGRKMLSFLQPGSYIGKLFAADDRRRVRDPFYLSRMFGRSDAQGNPLLSLGGLHGSDEFILDTYDSRAVAYLSLQQGCVDYSDQIYGLLPAIGKGLSSQFSFRQLLSLHQEWTPYTPKSVQEGEILLVRTPLLNIQTAFARVVDELLPHGYHHTSASVLQPDTKASGDIYEFFGNSQIELIDVPLEFYTLEPYREHVFFADRDQLKQSLEDEKALFKAFETAPKEETKAAVFIVKGKQMLSLKEKDWLETQSYKQIFPRAFHGARQALMIERYIQKQPSYPFLKQIEEEVITSQGVLFSKHLPSPFMKRMLLSNRVQRCLKGIYFQSPSLSSDTFFSHEDQSLLRDLNQFAIPVYWVDTKTETLLKYVQRQGQESGMFVPTEKVNDFLNATFFGIYGSNLLEGGFEKELRKLFEGLLEKQNKFSHQLMQQTTPLALVTGGGPGAMEVGNRVAKELGILSCAHIVDFRSGGEEVKEQYQNPYVEAKMSYRLDRIVERQAEFNLDFPIFLTGGIGTDFEFALEELRRKVGNTSPNPVLLFGNKKYWQDKITSKFQCNQTHGTIKGSEWISNCLYCVENAKEALEVYTLFFQGKLESGQKGKIYNEGFVFWKQERDQFINSSLN